MAAPRPVRAFLSFAHEDFVWRDRVLAQLGWLRHSGQLQAFEDRQIKPGEQWDPRIRAELDAASIIIILISEHFVGSRYCTIEELVRAVERQRGGTADLVSIYCDWVDLEALPLSKHQVLPQNEKNDLLPLTAFGDNVSRPLSKIAAAVRRIVETQVKSARAVVDLSFGTPGRFEKFDLEAGLRKGEMPVNGVFSSLQVEATVQSLSVAISTNIALQLKKIEYGKLRSQNKHLQSMIELHEREIALLRRLMP